MSSSVGMMTFPTEWTNKKCSKPSSSYSEWVSKLTYSWGGPHLVVAFSRKASWDSALLLRLWFCGAAGLVEDAAHLVGVWPQDLTIGVSDRKNGIEWDLIGFNITRLERIVTHLLSTELTPLTILKSMFASQNCLGNLKGNSEISRFS